MVDIFGSMLIWFYLAILRSIVDSLIMGVLIGISVAIIVYFPLLWDDAGIAINSFLGQLLE